MRLNVGKVSVIGSSSSGGAVSPSKGKLHPSKSVVDFSSVSSRAENTQNFSRSPRTVSGPSASLMMPTEASAGKNVQGSINYSELARKARQAKREQEPQKIAELQASVKKSKSERLTQAKAEAAALAMRQANPVSWESSDERFNEDKGAYEYFMSFAEIPVDESESAKAAPPVVPKLQLRDVISNGRKARAQKKASSVSTPVSLAAKAFPVAAKRKSLMKGPSALATLPPLAAPVPLARTSVHSTRSVMAHTPVKMASSVPILASLTAAQAWKPPAKAKGTEFEQDWLLLNNPVKPLEEIESGSEGYYSDVGGSTDSSAGDRLERYLENSRMDETVEFRAENTGAKEIRQELVSEKPVPKRRTVWEQDLENAFPPGDNDAKDDFPIHTQAYSWTPELPGRGLKPTRDIPPSSFDTGPAPLWANAGTRTEKLNIATFQQRQMTAETLKEKGGDVVSDGASAELPRSSMLVKDWASTSGNSVLVKSPSVRRPAVSKSEPVAPRISPLTIGGKKDVEPTSNRGQGSTRSTSAAKTGVERAAPSLPERVRERHVKRLIDLFESL